jgi:hypothetical protein
MIWMRFTKKCVLSLHLSFLNLKFEIENPFREIFEQIYLIFSASLLRDGLVNTIDIESL